MDGPNLLALEGDPSRTFRFRHAGEVYKVPGPSGLGIYEVLAILADQTIPGSTSLNLPIWKSELLFARWCAHYDLPPLQSLQRLCVLLDRYRNELEVDFQTHYNGLDVMELWRARKFRSLLNFIDHLPTNTWYHEAVVKDPDHVRQLVEAEERAKDAEDKADGKPPAPSVHVWSPEMAQLTEVLDAVRDVSWKVEAVKSEKGKAPKHPPPAPRPESPLDAARKRLAHERRTKKHRKLASRLLPHKYDSEGNRLD